MLLPKPQVGWELAESDEIPSTFLEPAANAIEAATMASLLAGNRPAARIAWKLSLPNLLGTSAQWETWVKEAMKEIRSQSPIAHQGGAMGWFASAVKLELGLDQLWFVDPILQAWDDSLSTHLQQLLINAPGTAGRE